MINDVILGLCYRRIFLAAVRRGGKMEAGRFVMKLLQRSRWKIIVAWTRMAAGREVTHGQIVDKYKSQTKRIY